MFSHYSVLCFCIALQVSASLPASPSTVISKPSYGTLIADDFDKSTAKINLNLHKGATSIAEPMMRFGMETLPEIAHLYAIVNGVNIPSKLAELGKAIYGKLAFFVGGGLLKGAVIASSIGGNAMQVGGAGLESLNNVIEAAAKAGINLGDNMADLAIGAGSIGVDLSAAGLTAIGDGLLGASAGSLSIAQHVSAFIKALSADIKFAMESAGKTITKMLKDGTAVFANGIMTFRSEQHELAYKAIQEYVKVLGEIDISIKTLLPSLNLKISSLPTKSSMSKSFSSIATGGRFA